MKARRLANDLLAHGSSIRAMAAAAPVSRLHGRDAEVRALGDCLDVLASGRPAVALIEGEAGIGKTRLLAEFVDDAQRRGFQVAVGRAEELEGTRPFGVIAEALGCTRDSADPRRAAVTALLAISDSDRGPITVTSDPGLQFRAVDAFVDLVEELALRAPLVIGLDDLQWADPSSLLTIGAIGRRLTDLPVAVIGCYRPSPRVPQLQRAVDSLEAAGARQLRLGRLSEDAVSELVAESVAAEPGPGLMSEIAGAGGNPLFVTELLGAIVQEGILRTSGGRADVEGMTLPPTLRLTILRRLSFLPDETLQALRAASILGTSFTLTELSATTARPALDLSGVLAEAIAASVLADDGTRLRFRHDLIRDAIYEDVPGSVRLALHREAGQQLAAAGAPALQVAEHLVRGATGVDTEAVTWTVSAAHEAAAGSPDIAAGLLERAIELMDQGDSGRDGLLAERASSLMWAGRVAESADACREILDRAHDPAVDGPVRICLGLALLAGGRPHDAVQELQRARELPLLTDAERAAGLGWESIARMWLGDLDAATTTAEQTRSAAAVVGDHMAATIAVAMFGVISVLRGNLAAADRFSADAVRVADQSPGRQGHRYPVSAPRGFILIELDRLDEARASVDAGLRTSEELGIRWHLPSYQMVRLVERFIAGEWDDAVAEVEASRDLARETGETYTVIVANSVLALICLHRNDVARAATVADEATRQLRETGARYRAQWALCAQALVLQARDEFADAFALLNECWDLCAGLGLELEYRVLGPDLIRMALAAGDTERARAVSARVAELAARNDVPSLTGTALHCQGLVTGDPETLRAAVDAYARSPRRLEHALSCEDAGIAFTRKGFADDARPYLDRAVEIYERLDAARDLARIESVLRTVGIRRGRRGTRSRPQHGWASLTSTEQNVAHLVAEGLSNPQIGDRLFVSRRTVQTHLAHVFAKLTISSRAQLAAEVVRQRGQTRIP